MQRDRARGFQQEAMFTSASTGLGDLYPKADPGLQLGHCFIYPLLVSFKLDPLSPIYGNIHLISYPRLQSCNKLATEAGSRYCLCHSYSGRAIKVLSLDFLCVEGVWHNT